MGIFDHLRTWSFETDASPADCLSAFTTSLTKGGPQLMGTRWRVASSNGRNGYREAVATYEGRAGVVGALSTLSTRSTSEQDAAIGSTLVFRAVGGEEDTRTRCTMEMTAVTKLLFFFTADARFFRRAMNRVKRGLMALDPALVLTKV